MQWWNIMNAAGGAAAQAVNGAQPDFFDAAVRMAVVLACVIGIVIALAALLKKLNIMQRPLMGGRKTIRILETAYLGPKQSLALVQAGHDVLLLGLTPQQITMLSKLPDCGTPGTSSVCASERFDTLLDQAARDQTYGDAPQTAQPENHNRLTRVLRRFAAHRGHR